MRSNSNDTIYISAIYEITRLMGSSLNLKQNLNGVMKILSSYLNMKRATVVLRKDETSFGIISAHGMTQEEMKKGIYRLGEGIIGKVAKHGSPIVIPNIGDEPLFLNKTGTRKVSIKSDIAFLSVPIKFKNEILGVLSVDRLIKDKNRRFEDDLRLLKIVASIIAHAVKLHNELDKQREVFIEQTNALRMELKGRYNVGNMIGISDKMQEVFEAIHKVAPSKATVLLRGESGTGKELVAKAIHYMSPRAKGPFIKINCASIPEGLLESELFGHEKGAFTGATTFRKGKFEIADKGTIFLDEIGDLPINLQPKILRVLQEKEFERVGDSKVYKVDVRLIAATSRDLESLVQNNQFREDLYYRLNVVPIFLPPLRQRKEDIIPLINYFMEKFNKENNKSVELSSEAIDVLVSYDWYGNVRELENTIERLVIMSGKNILTPSDLPLNIRHFKRSAEYSNISNEKLTTTIDEIEKREIINALKKCGGVQAKAARLLGITVRQIGYKIIKHGIDIKDIQP
ncbi:MAG: sigma 54-interacting transcriptional regulator [Thermodesulfovibrionales bacterium]|nr:sigma 54-interacting transcriptional regulator [Thermodesulfovibrionales bacterium]